MRGNLPLLNRVGINTDIRRVPARAIEGSSGCRTAHSLRLVVKECVPGVAYVTRSEPLRFASVTKPEEALSLPWIQKLPGEKRIKFLHGQVFVVQHYVGCKLIRAHICRDEERCGTPIRSDECESALSTLRDGMSLEYVR